MILRPSRRDDREAISSVVAAAFAGNESDGRMELDVVGRTWRLGTDVQPVEIVAELDGRVIGHALSASGDLSGRTIPGIAPVSIAPAHQGRGIGTALVQALVGAVDDAGWPVVVLLGSTHFYSRFGFEPAGPLGITYPPVGADNPHFQARRLSSYDPGLRGDFRYCWETTAD